MFGLKCLPNFVHHELGFATEPFVNVLSIIDHHDPIFADLIVYLKNDAKVTHVQFIGFNSRQLLATTTPRFGFKPAQLLNNFIVNFARQAC